MANSTGRLAGTLVVLAVISVALVACQQSSEVTPAINEKSTTTLLTATPAANLIVPATTVGPPATSSDPGPIPVQAPALTPPPDLNRDIHSVDLKDIVFDTFDGSSTRLSAASNDLIERLRDAIKPIYSAQYDDVSGGGWLTPDDTILGYVSDEGRPTHTRSSF